MPVPVRCMVDLYVALLRDDGGARPPSKILLAGESAGGGMALLVLQALLDRSSSSGVGVERMPPSPPLPAGAILLSPWVTTDFDDVGPSLAQNDGRDPNANMKAAAFVARAASGWVDRSHGIGMFKDLVHSKQLSPLYGTLQGLPPLFMSAGEADVLVSSQRKFREQAQ